MVTPGIEAKSGAEIVDVAPGLVMMLPSIVRDTEYEIDGHPYDVKIELNMTDEGVRPVNVEVKAKVGSPAITSTTLRAVRVWDLTQFGLAHGVGRKVPGGMAMTVGIDVPNPESIRLGGPTQEAIELTARIYNMALVLGLPPNRSVRDSLGLASTTASEWIRRARDRGLVGEPKTGPRVATRTIKGMPIEEVNRILELPRRPVGGDN